MFYIIDFKKVIYIIIYLIPLHITLNENYYQSMKGRLKIVSLGSWFAENMRSKFQYFKFQSPTNPFRIIFNSFFFQNEKIKIEITKAAEDVK